MISACSGRLPVPGTGRPKADRVAYETHRLPEADFDLLCAAADAMGVRWSHLLITAAVLHRHLRTGHGNAVAGRGDRVRTRDQTVAIVQPHERARALRANCFE